jgi:hypothetical protein
MHSTSPFLLAAFKLIFLKPTSKDFLILANHKL